ncbi:hypothetical protein J6590_104904, partial [Homalodisca vitripennis]
LRSGCVPPIGQYPSLPSWWLPVIPVKLLAGERKAIYQRQGEIGKDAARYEERALQKLKLAESCEFCNSILPTSLLEGM